jgi:hypothetical protein
MFGFNPAIQGGPPVTGGGGPLLDTLTNTPMGAWTMDLERAAYAGSCLRVRNNTTGVETDIGFSGGVLNNAAMATALGTDGGTASVWYNQVAGGPNLVPPTGLLANRPRPFDDVTPLSENTLQPAIPPLGGGTYLSALDFATTLYPPRQLKISLSPGSTTKWMLTAVIVFNGGTVYSVLNSYDAGSGDNGSGGSRMLHGNGTVALVDQAGVEGSSIYPFSADIHVVTTYADGTNIGVYIDGVVGTSVACSAPIGASGTFVVGCMYNGINPWMGGYLKAMIFWNTYSNSDRLLAEAWLRSKYGTP